eukprot:1161447-Pelagomonas_calceolata.AAC.4
MAAQLCNAALVVAVDMSKYNIVSRTELLGLGTLRAGSSLLKGTDTVYETVSSHPGQSTPICPDKSCEMCIACTGSTLILHVKTCRYTIPYTRRRAAIQNPLCCCRSSLLGGGLRKLLIPSCSTLLAL